MESAFSALCEPILIGSYGGPFWLTPPATFSALCEPILIGSFSALTAGRVVVTFQCSLRADPDWKYFNADGVIADDALSVLSASRS